MKTLRNLPVLILGLGASGLAMARWCVRHGAQVSVADTRETPPQLAMLQQEMPQVRFIAGPFSAALLEGESGIPVAAVYRSPGLSPATLAAVLDAAQAAGLVVGGELDLFVQALSDLYAERAAALPEIRVSEAANDGAAPSPPLVAPLPAQEEVPVGIVVAEGSEPLPAEVAPLAEQPSPHADPRTGPYVPRAAREAAEFVASFQSEPLAAAADSALLSSQADAVTAAVQVAASPASAASAAPKVLAITGTNGKTTVTSLTAQLVERAGKSVAVAGNIGPTLLDTLAQRIDSNSLPEVWVLELSSFQLEGVRGFEPTAATVLNLTQDHLEWHGDMAAYGAAKARIFGSTALMVLNRDDALVMDMLPAASLAEVETKGRSGGLAKTKAQRPPSPRAHLSFGAGLPTRPGDWGLERSHGMTWLVRAQEAEDAPRRKRAAAAEAEEIHLQRLMPLDALQIQGQHNALNALAALALAVSTGCPIAPMLYGLREYRGEPHRVESVAHIGGVEYIDDSKGTNVGATVAALLGLGTPPAQRKLVVILGGDGKGQDFAPLADPVRRCARAVVLMGRDAPSIQTALTAVGVPLLSATTLPEAVQLAARSAHRGDVVLLSPACASLDMFKDYVHRAQVFREAVQALAEDASPLETLS